VSLLTFELDISSLQAKNVTGTPVWLLIDEDINVKFLLQEIEGLSVSLAQFIFEMTVMYYSENTDSYDY
jgi:hypothetical protein